MSSSRSSIDGALGRRFLTPELVGRLAQNGATDPIRFYRAPLVGRLFLERINRGLRLLPERRFARTLEVGYAAGAVLLTLAPTTIDLHGIDLHADPAPVTELLGAHGHGVTLTRGSVYDLPYERGSFDLVVCFSVLEHLDRFALALDQISAVLAPGGLFLLGMPAVNPAMSIAFRAIGFPSIGEHHITTPASVEARFSASRLAVERTAHLDVPFAPPLGARLYYNWLLRREA